MKTRIFSLILIAFGLVVFTACTNTSDRAENEPVYNHDALNFYFGDIHNHCNITYGHGDLKDAFEAAKQQLDFVSVTPHAAWPDIPGRDDERLAWVIDYHTTAFDKLRSTTWPVYADMTKEYNQEGEFLTFISYEYHSMQYGDHVALNYDLDAPLVEANSVPELMEKLKDEKAFVTPHHMGYQDGFRGYTWKYFNPEKTPFVEIYSRHGLAEEDLGDFTNLHDMGPRNFEGTMVNGLNQGKKFGVIGSTDQHAGYPGSYGDGRIGVIAESNTREAIWDALQKRHVYCVTGDNIKVDFRINNAIMGDEITAKKRNISVQVEGHNFIDYVDIIKNGKRLARVSGPFLDEKIEDEVIRAKVKIEFGWNRFEEPVQWLGNLSISEGTINEVIPCFRGAAFTAPVKNKIGVTDLHKTLVNKVLDKSEQEVGLEMYTVKNPNTLTPATQAVILDVTMPKSGKITADFNGKQFSYTLDELLHGTKSNFMIGWLSEAIQFHRAAPEKAFTIDYAIEDNKAEKDTDYYYVRVRQRDNNWAFSSAIWVNKK